MSYNKLLIYEKHNKEVEKNKKNFNETSIDFTINDSVLCKTNKNVCNDDNDIKNINVYKKNKSNKKLRVLYLGGLYMAEYSLLHSFIKHNGEIKFIIDTNNFGNYYYNSQQYNNFKNSFVERVDYKELESFIIKYNPNVIIQRFYKNLPLMHEDSYKICEKLKIPYIKYIMETDTTDNSDYDKDDRFDMLLYSHDTDFILNKIKNIKKPTSFYPYGVSPIEYSIKKEIVKDIGTIGYYRDGVFDREKSFSMIHDAITKINKKINVYGGIGEWVKYKRHNDIIINDRYKIEDTSEIICQHNLMLNFETLPYNEGFYSYKIFQTIGSSVPTITQYKKCVENLFGESGENILMFNSQDDIIYWVEKVLNDSKFRKDLSKRSYKYIHNNFDWYKNLYKILKNHNII